MASMREIKRRKEGIQSTEQITKAMKLVATVKLQKAKIRLEKARPYKEQMERTVVHMLEASGGEGEYVKARESGKALVLAITSNRGLAGGYNNAVVRMIASSSLLKQETAFVCTVGRKGRDGLKRLGYEILKDFSDVMENPGYVPGERIAGELLDYWREGKAGEIYLAYTRFENTVSQVPVLKRLLPVPLNEDKKGENQIFMEYEPGEEEVLSAILPQYLSSMIYVGLLEAAASENGARMTAMDSAFRNAEEMIEELSLQYNRARQGTITQELTEIIAGAGVIDS